MTVSPKKRFYNLIFVCHEFPPIGGGAATALQKLSEELASKGHKVTVLTIGLVSPIDYKTPPNLSVVSLGNVRKNSLCPSLLEFLKSYILLKFKAPHYIKSIKPDVVISFFAFPTGHAIWSYLKKHHIPHIVSIRGVDAPGFHEERWGGITQFLIPHLIKPVLYSASIVYGNGKRLKNLVENRFKDIKVINIPNGVTLDEPLKIPRRNFSTLNLIFVGQLIERKRIKEALEGIIFFANTVHQKVNFTIVGTGILELELKKIAQTAPANLHIIFKEYMDREELSQLYNQQHVMVHLSHDEGVSNTLLEAFSKGLALIASHGAIYEFGDTLNFPGIVVRSFSPEIIGKGLRDIFSDEETLSHHFSRSIEIAKEFSWEKNAHKLLEQVEKILHTKHEKIEH